MTQSVADFFLAALPGDPVVSIADWARKHVRLPGSARSQAYDPDITPWTREPLELLSKPSTKFVTFVKPVQSGGSVLGEVALCFAVSNFTGGDIQYNWENDIKAGHRWDKRIEKILTACQPVVNLLPPEKRKAKRGLIVFPHLNLTVQGVFTDENVASDSIRFQINEEIHGWEPGRLSQAYLRTTAYWNGQTVNISNASVEGDQLHSAFKSGTQQHWEVLCPGCFEHHEMHARWIDEQPELGGLRYESVRTDDGDYVYPEIAKTVRYQMPCGHEIKDEPAIRRQLSLSGRYGEPKNPGAAAGNYSFTLDAVAVDYIPWIKLIEEKHIALTALAKGDPVPYQRYVQERECRFWTPDDRPTFGAVVTTAELKKNRDGIPDRVARFFALDRQRGSIALGEFPHWWLLIRDAKENGDSRLVFEGKVKTDQDVIGILDEHGCIRRCGVADSGDDTTHVYQFCLQHGINAVKGDEASFFHHDGGARRIYSPERPLHSMVNRGPVHPYQNRMVDGQFKMVPSVDEPLFWFYSKPGVLDRLAWLRDATAKNPIDTQAGESVVKPLWEVPGDVSKDYYAHLSSWKLGERKTAKSKEVVRVWEQVSKRDDLHWCERMVAMLMEMAGLIGQKK